ncbi:hypothetical protein QAD02_023447 [Eretmocerus hayati]|uniref:Uncharacterized protein n=1 Tax=Eretmocerus hayati TaxID=131215 RepID=A0ACC2PVY7_9HYME|nr:hypothetical protein QAD02_023447 [Eretmocerus hayati]
MQRKLSSRQFYGLKTYSHLWIHKQLTYMRNRTYIKVSKQWAEGHQHLSRALAWVKSRTSQNQPKMSGGQDLVNSVDGAFTQDEEVVIQQICALPNIEIIMSGQITNKQKSEVSPQCANEAVKETEITKDVNNDHDQRVQEIMRELVNSSEEDSALKSSDWLSQFDLSPTTPNMSTEANYNECGHSHDAGNSTALQYELLGNQESVNDNTLRSMYTTDAVQYYEHATSSGYMIDEPNNETYTHGLPCYNENNIWRSTQSSTRDEGAISTPMNQCEYNVTEKINKYKNATTSYTTDNAEGRNITSSGHVFNLYGNTVTSGTEDIRRNAPKQNA